MSENNTAPKELSAWDELNTEQLPAVELFDNNEHVVTFLVDKPIETLSHKFKGKKVMLFGVTENNEKKTLIVTSIRLALKLKAFGILKDKTLGIKRIGERTDIDYVVRDVNAVTTEEVKVE